ncbi:hypothetical protein [Aestuariimicrobium kwangyangense]|uniref:hypothetical protein n=1 Tax=Aestuariimicrobium kwangyangense TaxID=396389 RepID=UPI0003B42971|nr:hypothetical protein [Aestuariimicrobium kwangyangense]
MNSRTELDHLFATEGVVASRDCLPRQRRMLSRLLEEGAIARVLPGIYAPAAVACDLRVRCAAIRLWDPDAVVSGLAAAQLTFWPMAKVGRVQVHSRRKRHGPAWLRLSRSVVPDEQVVTREGLRVTRSAWTAVQRAAHDSGEAIDTALRERAIKLDDLFDAWRAHCGRHANAARRPVVLASRTNPWSQGERGLHRELRVGGVKGWVANHWVALSAGRVALDVAFPGLRLGFEFDGYAVHGNREAFERDRERRNALYVEAGWTVLNITWAMLADPAAMIRMVRRAISRAKVSARRRVRTR